MAAQVAAASSNVSAEAAAAARAATVAIAPAASVSPGAEEAAALPPNQVVAALYILAATLPAVLPACCVPLALLRASCAATSLPLVACCRPALLVRDVSVSAVAACPVGCWCWCGSRGWVVSTGVVTTRVCDVVGCRVSAAKVW